MRSRITLIAALVLCGCPTHANPAADALNYLPRPFYQFATDNGLCKLLYAVDGNNQGWQEESCGLKSSGLLKTHVLTGAQVTEISTAFAALPAMQDPACVNDHAANNTITTLRRAMDYDAGTDVAWIACVTSDGGDALTQPYASAVATLEELVQSPSTTDL